MKKTLLFLALALLFLPSCTKESPEPLYQPEEEPETRVETSVQLYEGISYALYSDKTCHITEVESEILDLGTLVLPSTVEGYTVVAIEDEAFLGGMFTSLTLPEKIEYIGERAFQRCLMEKLVLPDSVTFIGQEAFQECYNLKEVHFSKKITQIPYAAFYGCRNLEKVELPEGVKAIEEEAFGGCRALSDVTLPATLEQIGPYAFWNCTSPSLSFAIGENVKKIGKSAFDNTAWKKSLTQEWVIVGDGVLLQYNGAEERVTLPDTVRFLSSAFDKTPVKSLTLNDGLAGIAPGALKESGVESVTYTGEVEEIKKEIGAL